MIENTMITIELYVIFISIIILRFFRINFYGKIIDKIPKNIRILQDVRISLETKRLKNLIKIQVVKYKE